MRYEQLMTDYGVTINRNKSIISRGGLSQIEYAKRLFINGQEISGLKFTILDSSSRNIKLLPDLFKLMNLRGYSPDPERFVPMHIPKGKLWEYASVLLNQAGFEMPILNSMVTFTDSFKHNLKVETFRLRLANLEKQRDLIFQHLEENKPIKGLFDKAGI